MFIKKTFFFFFFTLIFRIALFSQIKGHKKIFHQKVYINGTHIEDFITVINIKNINFSKSICIAVINIMKIKVFFLI